MANPMSGARHRSHGELAEAGFRFLKEVDCRHCTERVLLYQAPEGFVQALERETFAQHRPRCSGRNLQQQKLFEV